MNRSAPKQFIYAAFAVVIGLTVAVLFSESVIAHWIPIDTPPGLFKVSATRNFEHRPYFKGKDRLWNPIRINSMGLRDREYPLKKNPGVFRIFVLGDSVAFGDGLPVEDTFAKQLERALNKKGSDRVYEVINGGVRGYNTYHELAMLKEVGLLYEPDLVIVAYVLNDAEPVANQRGLIGEKYAALIPIKDYIKQHSYLYALFRRALELARHKVTPEKFLENYDDQFNPDHPGWKLSVSSLGRMKQITDQKRIRLLLAVIPRFEWQPGGQSYASGKIQDQVVGAGQLLTIDTLDLFSALKTIDADRLKILKEDVFHPNAKGNELIAEAIRRHLAEEGVLK